MQQKASKKQLLSSCRLALKSSLANVNELSGPRQYRLRQDRCLLLRQDRCLLLRQDRCLLLRDKRNVQYQNIAAPCHNSRHLSCLNLYQQGPESSLTFASELFNARWHEERSCFLEALCCILLMIPCDFERICLQHAATECMQKSSNTCQKN